MILGAAPLPGGRRRRNPAPGRGNQSKRHAMSVETRVKLKLSIWRDFVPGRRLDLSDDEGNTHHLPDSESSLQEEVYSCHLWEDFRDGIADDKIRRRLDDHLCRLDASCPPSERRLSVLDDFIAEARKAIASGKAGLSPIQSPPVGDEDAPDAINALLALTLHLEWLSRCFANRPGISVSIR